MTGKKETEKIERALKLVEKWDYSYMRAAKEVGLSRATVEKWAKKRGIMSPLASKLAETKYQQRELKEYKEAKEVHLTLWQRIKRLFNF